MPEVFANDVTGTVTSGGTTGPPSAGTSEAWTVNFTVAAPVAGSSPYTWFYLADTAAGAAELEKVLVTSCPGGTGSMSVTVTRGADGTAPALHLSGFTVQQVVARASLAKFTQTFNVLAYGAKGDGSTDDTAAIQAALSDVPAGGGTVFFPGGYNFFSAAGGLTPRPNTRISGMGRVSSFGSQVTLGSSASYPLFALSLAPPAAPSVAHSGSGSTITVGTYQVKVTYVNLNGESLPSASTSVTTTSGQNIIITSPAAAAQASGWYAYVTAAGGSTYFRQQAPGSPTAIGTNLTLTANPGVSGANPPTSNTTAASGCVIDGLDLTAQSAGGTSTTAIDAAGGAANYMMVSDCWFAGFWRGISIDSDNSTFQVWITRNYVNQTANTANAAGVAIRNVQSATITENFIQGNGLTDTLNSGILVPSSANGGACQYSVIANNNIGQLGQGIFITDVGLSDSTVNGNQVTGIGKQGIYLHDIQACAIVNNTAGDCSLSSNGGFPGYEITCGGSNQPSTVANNIYTAAFGSNKASYGFYLYSTSYPIFYIGCSVAQGSITTGDTTLQPGTVVAQWTTVTSSTTTAGTYAQVLASNGAHAAPVLLPAGTATAAPLAFQSGTSLTTATAGAAEYDGTAFYATAAASSRQVLDAEQFQALTSPYTTVSGSTALQQLFNATANGTLTVQASTTYFFECEFDLTAMSSSSGTFSFGFGGTATFTSLKYWASAQKSAAAGTLATWPSLVATTAAATALVSASTTTTGAAVLRGILRVNAAGTIIPSFAISVASAAVVGVNSWFRIWPAGSNTVTSVGNWS